MLFTWLVSGYGMAGECLYCCTIRESPNYGLSSPHFCLSPHPCPVRQLNITSSGMVSPPVKTSRPSGLVGHRNKSLRQSSKIIENKL